MQHSFISNPLQGLHVENHFIDTRGPRTSDTVKSAPLAYDARLPLTLLNEEPHAKEHRMSVLKILHEGCFCTYRPVSTENL